MQPHRASCVIQTSYDLLQHTLTYGNICLQGISTHSCYPGRSHSHHLHMAVMLSMCKNAHIWRCLWRSGFFSIPNSLVAWGLPGSRSATTATGYHCSVHLKLSCMTCKTACLRQSSEGCSCADVVFAECCTPLCTCDFCAVNCLESTVAISA